MAERDYSRRGVTQYELHAHLRELEALAAYVPAHVLAQRLLSVLRAIDKLDTPVDLLNAKLGTIEDVEGVRKADPEMGRLLEGKEHAERLAADRLGGLHEYERQCKELQRTAEARAAEIERLKLVRAALQKSTQERHDRIQELEAELESWRNAGVPGVRGAPLSREFNSGATREPTREPGEAEEQEGKPARGEPYPPQGTPPRVTPPRGFTVTWPRTAPLPGAGGPKFEVYDPSKADDQSEPEVEVTVEEKTCTRCGAAKPAAEFYKQRKSKDGLHAWCKDCFKKQARERKERKRAEAEAQAKAKSEAEERERAHYQEIKSSRRAQVEEAEERKRKEREAREREHRQRGQGKARARLCARGRLCLHYPEIQAPASLAEGNVGPLCDRCERARHKDDIDQLRQFPNTHPLSAGRSRGTYCSNGKRCAGFSAMESTAARPNRLSEDDGPVCKACLQRAGLG